jgi:large repetitive protein
MRLALSSVTALCFAPLSCVAAVSALAGAAYTYDALGRIVSVRYDDGKQIVYVYDPAGNRTQEVVSATTVNRAPIAVADAVTLTEDLSSLLVSPVANDSDPDNNPLTLFSVSNGDFGTASPSGASVTYASTYKRNAVDKLAYTITDTQGMNASGEIAVTLANLNPTPASDSATTTVAQGVWIDVLANDSDPGSDPLTLTAASTPAHGTATIANFNGLKIRYEPTAGYAGPDTFTYTLSDGDGGSAVGTVNVTVNNQPPVAANDSGTGSNTNFPPINVLANDSDPDSDTLVVSSVSSAEHGTVTILSNGQVQYTPGSGYVGPDFFTYVTSDPFGGTSTGTVSLNVTGQ